ncbi:hypothetical protein ACIQ6V_22775 [Streptomyces sp. NPDC096198]|uniref:hypothetical protein n=1 Tax=Streptomyces sp. NPDC096198 TaxID=3366080 RepID=UPI003813CDC8
MRPMSKGLLAGAVGTVALDLAGYGDMLLRGRSPSDLPAQVAGGLADRAGVGLGEGVKRSGRAGAIGAMLGYLNGLGLGCAYGLWQHRGGSPPLWTAGSLLALAAMAGSDLPATALRLTAPASWPPMAWVSDLVPHLAYGVTTAAVFEALG